MSNEMVQFDFGKSPVRVHVDGDGVTWWVAADVCKALGIANTTSAIKVIPEEERNTLEISEGILAAGGNTVENSDGIRDGGNTLSNSEGIRRGNPNVNVISEPGLYRLIFRSNKPAARTFTDWVVKEVLPSLRKTGSYAMPGSDSAQIRARGLLDGMELAEMMEARGLSLTQFKRFVCLCGKGLSSPEIGKIMGRTGRTIQRWRNDFSASGLRLLPQDAPDPKCPREFAWAMLAAAGVDLPQRRAA